MTVLNLCIDTGNTHIKAGIFQGRTLLEKHLFRDYTELIAWAEDKMFSNSIISSVKGDEEVLTKHLKIENFYVFPVNLNLPVKNLYDTPDTLGKDRLAAVTGAGSLFPDRNCLVIDAGTCITYDILNADNEYLGGAISPGLTMRFKALNAFTAKLPLLQPQNDVPLTGRNTYTGIVSGVQNGMLFEIMMTIQEYQKKYPDLQVILCGGDSEFFESKIKGAIFAFPDLVLVGLNHTLLYNAHR